MAMLKLSILLAVACLWPCASNFYVAANARGDKNHLNNSAISITTNFVNATFSRSASGLADCVEGFITVAAQSNQTNFRVQQPADNLAATQLLLDFYSPRSNFSSTIDSGNTLVSGTYDIYSKLCEPRSRSLNATKTTSLLFLTHGGTLDHTWWDFAPSYSLVDAAASKGYITFSYDRLGTASSTHPDPIQIVQIPLQIQIAHELISILRNSRFTGSAPANIIGVGHSEGSAITQGVAARYPADFEGLVLTGHSNYLQGATLGAISTLQQIANTQEVKRFQHLSNGYLTPAPVLSAVQFAFYHFPGFTRDIFERQFRTRQTTALGETFTLGAIYESSTDFAGPVAIFNGRQDLFYCGGDCDSPTPLLPAALAFFFPKASNQSRTASFDQTGHNLNLHFTAPSIFQAILRFVSDVEHDQLS